MRRLLIVLAILSLAGPAWGHGPGTEWLMDGGYRNSVNEHCCTPDRDCLPIPDSDLELTPQGWKYLPTDEVIGERDTFRSLDPQGRHWRCHGTIHWYNNTPHAKTRCLFIAPGTT